MTHPAVHPETPRLVVPAGCTLGEGPVWDHRNGHLLWVDIKGQAVWRWNPDTDKTDRVETPEPVGFVALTPDPDIVVAGFRSGLCRLHLWGGQVQPMVSPEPGRPGNRINDGHVGPSGILYFGTMNDGGDEPTGSFWAYDGEQLNAFHGNIVTTNGPAVSADGQTLYTADSRGQMIYAHDLDDGVPGEPRRFARFEEGWGHPDGMAMDAQGHLWACHYGGSRITRFAPDGSVERTLPVPTALVTKCAFGGPDLSTLYITTARQDRDPRIDPMAGHVFAVDAGVKGLPANIFTGKSA